MWHTSLFRPLRTSCKVKRIFLGVLCAILLIPLTSYYVAAQSPTIIVSEPEDGAIVESQTITLRATILPSEGTTIDHIEIRLNGLPVIWEDGKGVDPVLPNNELNQKIQLEEGENHILFVAANGADRMEQMISVTYSLPKMPDLYLLAVGISDYARDDVDLSYADLDAQAIVDTFTRQKDLFFDQVISHILLNEQATRNNILKDLEWIRHEVTQRDLAIVFISGHGVRHQDWGDYYFLPYDGDPTSLINTAVPWLFFENMVRGLAGKAVFFVDTCHAGGITGVGQKSAMPNLIALQDFAGAGRGLMVLASSRDAEMSLERPEWTHGAFTRAILDGLAGGADANGNHIIDTKELDAYVTNRVKELTGGAQHAVTNSMTSYTAFPLFVLASEPEPASTIEPVTAIPKGEPPTDTPEALTPDLSAETTIEAQRLNTAVAATLTALAPPPTDTPVPPTDTPIPSSKLGDTWTRPADDMVMVYVPGGEFRMGSEDGENDERPVHTVALDAFWVDRTEVTNAQYQRCVEVGACAQSASADDSNFNGDAYPVVSVSWNNAQSYCQWAGARLPTEAEWEYAVRGPDGWVYPWGNTVEEKKLNAGGADGYDYTAPVGSYQDGASWVGALDMAGNVWEWVADWYGPYPSDRQVNPTGPESGSYRLLRGGSWYGTSDNTRGAYRDGINPGIGNIIIGFRCARNP